jgi:putative glutamine amidotransferase
MKLHIGLSYAPQDIQKYQKYANAVRHAADELGYEVLITDLSSAPTEIENIDGILFTGGDDVDPARFEKPEEVVQCEIDPVRDELEFTLAKRADERKLPVFGICRGLQLLNVYYGGTLITDLLSAGLPNHSKINGVDQRHDVQVDGDTFLKKLTRAVSSQVTSAHHQAIDDVARGMRISARAADNEKVIEAIEWEEPQKHAYFMAVQWHPERMEYHEPLAGELFENFLNEVAMQKTLSRRL